MCVRNILTTCVSYEWERRERGREKKKKERKERYEVREWKTCDVQYDVLMM